MKILDVRFERAAARPEDEPRPSGAAVVFCGRSNVGKSTLINALLGTKGLARTSSTPGRTQTINFYRVNGKHDFIDLPGYGWARAPERVRRAWRPMVEGFFARRRSTIAAAVVAVDARRGVGEADRAMLAWLLDRDIPAIVVGVKTDKLTGNDRSKAARALEEALPTARDGVAPFLVSAATGLGIATLWRHLDAALGAARVPGTTEKGWNKDRRWTSAR